ncbi:MAG: nucleoside triphosphate pyrophosphatase [Patescibacteria group bacterium]|nr:nucleoside triphosphate pyrophosphatase [Patescibacteria group bacterium]
MRKIILASKSKQREKLLKIIGLDFEIEKSDYLEDMTEKIPAYKLARKLAFGKAQDIAQKHKDAIVIGADTFLILGKELLGKPHTPQKAKKMLRKISGKKHKIITGVAIIDTKKNKVFTDCEITEIWFKKLSEKEIEKYIRTSEPLDKAGSYTIQGIGAIFVKKINGNFDSAVGLPIGKIYKYLLKLGVDVLESKDC